MLGREDGRLRGRILQLAEPPSGKRRRALPLLRDDPSYTPNIEHLVFPERRSSNPRLDAPKGLFRRGAPADAAGGAKASSGGAGGRWWERERRASPEQTADMAATRGPNVSVLHVRGPDPPWDPPGYGTLTRQSRSNGPTIQMKPSGYASLPHSRRRETLLLASASAGSCSRELSPVRWCDREVDGVYLGRSGWVQVQQRSLDDNRRSNYAAPQPPPAAPRRPPVKLADYHCNSEPGKLPPAEQNRPAYLPLPLNYSSSRSTSPSPLQGDHEVPALPMSPPSITPIISPPPAFQDNNTRKSSGSSRMRFNNGKPPFLPRSNAIVESDVVSPPTTPPPPPVNWSTLPSPRSASTSRIRRLTPSPVGTPQPQLSRIPQSKSVEDTTATGARRSQFQKYDSSSSSSSSFGFRSLDNTAINPRAAMPRLSETDSSMGGYEDGDEDDNRDSSLNLSGFSSVTVVNSSPDTPLNSILQTKDRMLINGEKVSPSSGRHRDGGTHHKNQRYPLRRSPGSESTNSNKKQVSGNCSSSSSSSSSSEDGGRGRYHTWDGRTRVRRSRSLQLPDTKSPSPRAAPRPPDDAWDAREEARLVTDYLYGARSRAAARALLMHRFHQEPPVEDRRRVKEPPPEPGFNVVVVGRRRTRVLQRGVTTPSPAEPKPCSPHTCDFWPHCAHRPNMRLSQSYPTASQRGRPRRAGEEEKVRRSDERSNGTSTRSSPASLERVDEHKSPNGLEPDDKKQQTLRTSFGRRVKAGLETSTSSTSSSVDRDAVAERKREMLFGVSLDEEFRKVSPVSHSSRSPSAKGNSSPSSSSSSSDVWVTTSDRTVTKSPRAHKSSGASTPLEEASSRPGSAPAPADAADDDAALDAQQRSLSLPKSFLSERYGFKSPKPSGLFPWRRQPGSSPCSTPSPSLRPTTPEGCRTAPATPVKELTNTENNQSYRRSPALSKSVRHAKSVPNEDSHTSRSDWDIRSRTLQNPSLEKQTTLPISQKRLADTDKDLSQSQRSISGNSESVLQKFRKSFALKFNKKSGSREAIEGVKCDDDVPDELPTTVAVPDGEDVSIKDDVSIDSRFRFGPLVWRSSKERKKGKKAARNAKCNSGDSGIQIEMLPGISNVTGGDSSESHDTDHLMDDEPLDEMDSPPAVRRRVTSTITDKSSRPQSELIQQLLIDKLKNDLQTRSLTRHQQVRRTHSDLGGQRLFHWDTRASYRRMFSTPSPIKMRPSPPRPTNTEMVQIRNSRRRSMRPQLRRSLSQPLGLNELSPLMRRKPGHIPVPRASTTNVLSEDEHDTRITGISDDEMMSDSESSVTSLSERKKSFEQAMEEDQIILAEAVWDHVTMEPDELAFRAGDVIEVLDMVNRDWWWGAKGEVSGWFPAAFVRLRVSQEDTVEDCLAAMASGCSVSTHLRRRTSVSLLSNDQVRSSVVRELINTERDFVKILTDVSEGYLAECNRRTDMFSEDQVQTIFGNLEDLLRFQTIFLEDLERRVDWEAPHRSCIGECFLVHRSGFRIYSEYCNGQPMATALLQELYQHNSYSKFFEACRLMRGLIEIPLDGYLLTPVQRICKYPLQLGELLKYTKADHPDHEKIKEALEAMRDVAVLINERKRRMESLEKLAAWQQRVEGWEGEDLIEASSQLIHQGEVVRVTTGMWTSNITLFLFDHQLIYCKKDILKRNTFVYKGRIPLDTSEVIDVPDGKDQQLGVMVRHGLKVYNHMRDKWLLFCCRSAEDKQKWLVALSEERRLVTQDRLDGLEFPPAAKELARMAAKRQSRPPTKPRSKNYKRDVRYMNGRQVHPNSHNLHNTSTNSLGRKVGTWFTFGSSKKGRSNSNHSAS